MEDLRFGACIRAERRRQRLRQRDVAERAGVAQQTVSVVERGRAGAMTLAAIRRVGAALGVAVALDPRFRGPEPERLLDARHARLVQTVIASLGPEWTVVPEYSFNHYGDRGSVDVLAWQPAARALLLVEAKSEIRDVQAMLRSMDVKARVLPGVVARERGWRPAFVGSVLALPAESSARRSVGRLAAVFAAALPARTTEIRRWLRRPSGPLRGVWFLADTPTRRAIRNPGSPGRVRVTSGAVSHAQAGLRTTTSDATRIDLPPQIGDTTPTTRS